MSVSWFKSLVDGQFRFRLVARNGKTIASSEAYHRKASMMKTIKRFWPRALVEQIKAPSS
jgi:hypothetical protein